MFNSKRNNSIDAIRARLTELGAKVVQGGNTGETQVRLDGDCIKRSRDLEIGFLLGQWALLVGIQFPQDFPKSKMNLGERLGVHADLDGKGARSTKV